MEFKTSRKVYGFTAIAIACATLGGIAQISQNLSSGRAEANKSNQLDVVAKHYLSDTCYPIEGGDFKIGQTINEEEGGKTASSCHEAQDGNKGKYAFVADLGGKRTVIRVFSKKELQAQISQIKEKKNE